MKPQINIQLQIRPRNIHVSSEPCEVNIFLEDSLAITLPVCYNGYTEAEEAAIEYIMEKLNSE